jgi:propionate CoA-transferase
VIGGYYGLAPRIERLALEGKIEAYNLPEGVIVHLYREIGARKPGVLSRVGLGTFVDPRVRGGKVNAATREDIVEICTAGGEEALFYKSFPIHVAFIRGTTADPDGNVTLERSLSRSRTCRWRWQRGIPADSSPARSSASHKPALLPHDR